MITSESPTADQLRPELMHVSGIALSADRRGCSLVN
jgi:hypothetical protein